MYYPLINTHMYCPPGVLISQPKTSFLRVIFDEDYDFAVPER